MSFEFKKKRERKKATAEKNITKSERECDLFNRNGMRRTLLGRESSSTSSSSAARMWSNRLWRRSFADHVRRNAWGDDEEISRWRKKFISFTLRALLFLARWSLFLSISQSILNILLLSLSSLTKAARARDVRYIKRMLYVAGSSKSAPTHTHRSQFAGVSWHSTPMVDRFSRSFHNDAYTCRRTEKWERSRKCCIYTREEKKKTICMLFVRAKAAAVKKKARQRERRLS